MCLKPWWNSSSTPRQINTIASWVPSKMLTICGAHCCLCLYKCFHLFTANMQGPWDPEAFPQSLNPQPQWPHQQPWAHQQHYAAPPPVQDFVHAILMKCKTLRNSGGVSIIEGNKKIVQYLQGLVLCIVSVWSQNSHGKELCRSMSEISRTGTLHPIPSRDVEGSLIFLVHAVPMSIACDIFAALLPKIFSYTYIFSGASHSAGSNDFQLNEIKFIERLWNQTL